MMESIAAMVDIIQSGRIYKYFFYFLQNTSRKPSSHSLTAEILFIDTLEILK